MHWTTLFVGLVAVGWLVSVEYRLWLNLKILNDFQGRISKKEASPLRAVEK